MRTVTKKFKIYEYDELNSKAQNKVVNDYYEYCKDGILEYIKTQSHLMDGDIFNE